MPGFDGTGPRGIGPMTGGGRGFCNPYGLGTARRLFGAGLRTGYGFPGVAPTREQELDFLKSETQNLKRALEEIDDRIKELTGEESVSKNNN